MNKPNRVLARGHKWGWSNIADGWGEFSTQEQADQLAQIVVDRFDSEMDKLGISASWFPTTSEVIGPDADDYNLDEIRERIIEQVFNELIDGELEGFLED